MEKRNRQRDYTNICLLLICVFIIVCFISCKKKDVKPLEEERGKVLGIVQNAQYLLLERKFQEAIDAIDHIENEYGELSGYPVTIPLLKAEYYQGTNNYKEMNRQMDRAREIYKPTLLRDAFGLDYLDYVDISVCVKTLLLSEASYMIQEATSIHYIEDLKMLNGGAGVFSEEITQRAFLVGILILPRLVNIGLLEKSDYEGELEIRTKRLFYWIQAEDERYWIINLLAEIYGFRFKDGKFTDEMLFSGNVFADKLAELIIKTDLKLGDIEEIKERSGEKKENLTFERYWNTIFVTAGNSTIQE